MKKNKLLLTAAIVLLSVAGTACSQQAPQSPEEQTAATEVDLQYDEVTSTQYIQFAKEAVLLERKSLAVRTPRDELEKYFTAAFCDQIEGRYPEDFVETDPFPFEIYTAYIGDRNVTVVLYNRYAYELFHAYFLDGKVDKVQRIETYFDAKEVPLEVE